ncbi:MAG: ParB N-terminal domain-containing protein [Acutalibacteraceae bacterium]
MKKMNFASITAGLDTLKDVMQQNAEIAQDKLIDVSFIDFASQNTFAADDTDESIRELADSIELLGLLEPLVVVRDDDRYTLIAGERRYKAITQCLHWSTVPCRVFDGEALSRNRKQLMLHEANGQRDLSAGRQLQIFEEYNALLEEMIQNGEYTGAKLGLIAKKMQISDRQVRKYKRIAEQLTQQEKEMLAAGELTVTEASQIAVARSKKAEPSSGSVERPEVKPEPSSGSAEQPEVKPEPSSGSTERQEIKPEPSSGSVEQPEVKPEPSSGSAERQEIKPELSSGFTEEAERFETPEARKALLEELILFGCIWEPEKLHADYVQQMPTTKEAIAKILKPRYNFWLCSISLNGLEGLCTLNASKLIVKIDNPCTTVIYSYTEVDAMIRELYRGGKLEVRR